MIREIRKEDKDVFISMVREFYNSDAVIHPIAKENILNTYKEVTADSPYAKAYIMEEGDSIAGYGLIALTYSNEAGGLVVWLEEIYIREEFRGLGFGGEFLDFIKQEFAKEAKRFRLEISEDNLSVEGLYMRKGYEKLEYIQMVLEANDAN